MRVRDRGGDGKGEIATSQGKENASERLGKDFGWRSMRVRGVSDGKDHVLRKRKRAGRQGLDTREIRVATGRSKQIDGPRRVSNDP